MPHLRAYKRGELTAQQAIDRAEFLDEAEAIVEEAKRRMRGTEALDGLDESYAA